MKKYIYLVSEIDMETSQSFNIAAYSKYENAQKRAAELEKANLTLGIQDSYYIVDTVLLKDTIPRKKI